jgi:hypothetical protein
VKRRSDPKTIFCRQATGGVDDLPLQVDFALGKSRSTSTMVVTALAMAETQPCPPDHAPAVMNERLS